MRAGKKKGQAISMATLPTIIALFAVGILVLTFTADIVDDVNADQTALSAAANVSGAGLTGMVNLSDQFGNIGTVIGAGLIIAMYCRFSLNFSRAGSIPIKIV